MTSETATLDLDQDHTAMPEEEKEGTVLRFPTNRKYEDFLSEGDGSQFNSPVSPTAELDPEMEEFRAKMRVFNMRLTTSRKVGNIKP